MLRRLPRGPFVLAEQREHGRRVLPLEALLHVLRGDDRVVVLGDDQPRHRAHLAERAGAPRAQQAQRQDESGVAEQQFRPQFHSWSLQPPSVSSSRRRRFAAHRHDLHGRVPHVAQEPIDDRPVHQQIPARPRGLAEDHVGDALALRELDERVGHLRALQLHDLRAELLRKPDVVGQRHVILRARCAPAPPGRLHVHGVPVRRQTSGDARADAEQRPGAAARGHRHHHLLGNDRAFETLPVAILLRLARLIGRELPQRQLAQRRQVALAEEVRQGLLDLRRVVDLALLQPVAKRLDRDVDVDHFVGALQHPVRNRLADAHAGRGRDRVVQRLDVLDVDGRDDADARAQQVDDVFVPLLVGRARGVGVRQLVDDGDLPDAAP